MHDETRRSFMGTIGVATIGGATMAATAAAYEDSTPLRKQIIPGSPYPTFSRAVRCGNMVYVSGVLGQLPGSRELASGGVEAEFRHALENLKASVEAAGSTLDKVVKCTGFLTDAADLPTYNKVYLTYFPADPPARSTVIVKGMVEPQARLEIECIAYV